MTQELIEKLERRMVPNPFRSAQGKLPDIVDPLCASAATALRTLQSQLAERERELAEADRRAGAAERKNADLQDTVSKRERWLANAKEQAGFHRNVSFDRVWEAALSAFLASKEQQ